MNKLMPYLLSAVLVSIPLVPSTVLTPDDLTQWFMKEGFTYQKETTKDYWKTPQETIKDKGGDCEDFVFLVDKVLSSRGYTVKPISISYTTTLAGHAIAVIYENNKYAFFSNKHYFSQKFDSIENLLNSYYPNWVDYCDISLNHKFKNCIDKKKE